MALGFAAFTPTKRPQQLCFETASLDGSSSPLAIEHATSPLKRDALPRKYTFTPQRVKSLPRAWERRPSTPYVARNEAQKIWKRVPLATITPHDGQSWRKADQKPIMRPVKKLRVAHVEQEENKENISYVTSKWDDGWRDSSSPKRKVASFTAINQEEATEVEDHEMQDDCGSEAVESDHKPDAVVVRDPFASIPVSDEAHIDGDILVPPHHLLDNDAIQHLDDVNFVDQKVQVPTSPAETPHFEHTEPKQALNSSTILESNSAEQSSLVSLQQNVLHDRNDQQPVASAPMDAATIQGALENSQSLLADQDDTAYLHEFLSRARAQKMAKQQPEQPSSPQESTAPSPQTIEDTQSCRNVSTPGRDNDLMTAVTSPTQTQDIDLQPDETKDVNPSSPCRRSSRLITRLPRPQKSSAIMPNNIALKRLTGTEFISQKEIQSVALTTRTNTKRNKGPAKTVQERLREIEAEAGTGEPESDSTAKDGKKKRKKMKEVSWAEQLARFQDLSVVANQEDDGVASEEGVASENIGEEASESAIPEFKDAVIDEEKKQARKVRKLRKINIGTVNGTPAPKKTTSLPVLAAPAVDVCSKIVSVSTRGGATPETEMQSGSKDGMVKTTKNSKPLERRLQTRMRTRKSG